MFLAQKPETVETLLANKRLAVSGYVGEQLKSLQSIPGRFAELAIKGPQGWSFGRLVLDPFSLTVYSSRGSTVERLRALKSRGHSTSEAIRAIVAEGGAV